MNSVWILIFDLSIFACNSIKNILKTRYKVDIKESPIMDVLGILIGTMIHRFNKNKEKHK